MTLSSLGFHPDNRSKFACFPLLFGLYVLMPPLSCWIMTLRTDITMYLCDQQAIWKTRKELSVPTFRSLFNYHFFLPIFTTICQTLIDPEVEMSLMMRNKWLIFSVRYRKFSPSFESLSGKKLKIEHINTVINEIISHRSTMFDNKKHATTNTR